MPEETAFNGRILNVNLTTGEIEAEELPEQMYREHLGGYGLGARLLFDRIPADADPLGPDNILGIFPGLLTGTPLFGQRFQVVCKSPKNGGWGDANCGGDFGPMLKFTGYDGILFSGKAERPVYLYVDDDTVELRDASEYWGMLAIDCEDRMKEQLGKKISVALIGPGGENLSYMAGVCNERGRLAARSGVGAVMGSKLLKAVVVKPTKKIMSQNKEVLQTVRASLNGFQGGLKQFFSTFGTTGLLNTSAVSGDSPVKNWGGVGTIDLVGDFDMANLNGPVMNENMDKKYACWHCPVACGAESVDGSDRGEFAFPHHTHRPEYETGAAFGSMTANNDMDSLIAVNHWCNQYGIDTISAGATVAFAIECYENGILTTEDTDGIELNWGNASSILKLLHKIGTREDGIGDILADGVKVAAERIGKGSERYAMHIDGEELPMHDPKLQPGYVASYKIDPTPARHTQYEASNSYGGPAISPAPKDRMDTTGRGAHNKDGGEYKHIINSAGMCMFIGMMAPMGELPNWINQVTGWDITGDELQVVGERIANLRVAFAVKHGNNPAARQVPGRIYGTQGEVQTEGPHAGVTMDEETLSNDFLRAMDWDLETTKPSRAKLESLGLKDVADVLEAV